MTLPHRIITDIKAINQKDWSDFVRGHPMGNIFQTPEMFIVNSISEKNFPVSVFCLTETRISGLVLAVIQQEYKGILKNFTSRAVMIGGPLVENNDPYILELIIGQYERIISNKVVYSEIRNLFDVNQYVAVFNKQGYDLEPHLNIRINLQDGKEALRKGMHPTRRKQVERSLRRGVKVKIADNPDSNIISNCYKLLQEVYKKASLPFPDLDFFIKSVAYLDSKNLIKVFIAEYESMIIGFRFVLCYNGCIYDWYAGSSSRYLDKYPNDILPWEIMVWGNENSYSYFDFGGAGRPGEPYGVRDYKLKFGGIQVNYGRLKKINKRRIYDLMVYALKIWKRIHSKR